MSYTTKKLPKSQIEILFEIPFEELEKYKKQVLEKLGKEMKVEGFRPGHIPESIIEEKVGQMAILEEASELVVKSQYQKAVSESNLEPIGQPKVEILKLAQGNPFEFKVSVSLLPEITLPDYKKIVASVERKKIEVSPKDLEDSLSWLQKSRAKTSLKGAESQKGDFVEIEYSSPQIEGGKKFQDNFILGEGHFVKGFEENLLGVEDGVEKDFSVKFPADYSQKDLADKDVSFSVKIKSVQKVEFPELNDEFAKSLGNFENADALKKNVEDGLKMEKEREESDRLRNEIMGEIVKEAICDVPEVLIDSEKQRMLADLKERVAQSQIAFEDYLARTKKTEKEILDSYFEVAKKRVKAGLALKEISKRENIEVSEDEMKEEINNFLKRYPDIKAAQSKIDEERLREYTKEAIRNEKTFKFLEGLVKN